MGRNFTFACFIVTVDPLVNTQVCSNLLLHYVFRFWLHIF